MAQALSSETFERVFTRLGVLNELDANTGTVPAVAGLIQYALSSLKQDEAIASSNLPLIVKSYFGLQLDEYQIQSAIQYLAKQGSLDQRGESIRLIPSVHQSTKDAIRIKATEANRVKIEWLTQVHHDFPRFDSDLDNVLWGCLEQYIRKAFRQHGQDFHRFLAPSKEISGPPKQLIALLNESIEPLHHTVPSPEARLIVLSFFRTRTTQRDRYISSFINGTVTLFALAIDNETSSYLRTSLTPFTVFIDTNVIYGVLDLHINPLDNVSQNLIPLITQHNLPITLDYHERTLGEFAHRIGEDLKSLKTHRTRWSQVASEAMVEDGYITGAEIKFHKENIRHGGGLDSITWSQRYLRSRELLQELGLNTYRSQTPIPIEDKTRVIDAYNVFSRQAGRYGDKAAQTLSHDVELLLTVERLRNQRGGIIRSSPLDAGAYFLTVDRHFQRFDVEANSRNQVPCVILPGQLLQLLRPFMSNIDESFDSRIAEMFGIPETMWLSDTALLSGKREASEYINKFGNAMSLEVATRILADQVLMRRISEISGNEEAIDNEITPYMKRSYEDIFKATEEIAAENSAFKEENRDLKDRIRQLEAELRSRHNSQQQNPKPVYNQPQPSRRKDLKVAAIETAGANRRKR